MFTSKKQASSEAQEKKSDEPLEGKVGKKPSFWRYPKVNKIKLIKKNNEAERKKKSLKNKSAS